MRYSNNEYGQREPQRSRGASSRGRYHQQQQYVRESYREPTQRRRVQYRESTQYSEPARYEEERKVSLFDRLLMGIVTVTSGVSTRVKKTINPSSGKPSVRVTNVVYEDCEKSGEYDKYLVKAGEDVE